MRNVDYYSVLGVSRTASAEDLKRRYRQLVRNHHPDVAADQEAAHERFILIVEAYRVLSDPVRRRAYDARQQAVPPPVRTQSVQVQEQIDDWFRHAVHRLEQGDLGGAAAQCRKILALDGHHAAAQAMLGDVHVQRQEWDQALVFYSGAVSAAPRNPAYARKLRLAAEAGQQARQAAERLEHLQAQRHRALEALNARHEFAFYTGFVALGWLIFLVLWARRDPGAPLAGWLSIPWRLALAGLGGGLAAGLALAANRFSTGFEDSSARRRRDATAAAAIGLLALGQFYLALVAYLVLAVVRERTIPSLTAGFAVAFVLVTVLSMLAAAAGPWLPTAAWIGNLILPALLGGQALGRLSLRPR